MTTTPNPTVPAAPTRPDVPELRRLLDAATEGPWFVVGPPWLDSGMVPYVVAGSPDPHAGRFVCDLDNMAGEAPTNPHDNAALIAALRNAAPWLLAQAAAVARVEALLSPDAGMATSPFGDGKRYFAETDVRAALAGPGVSE